MKKVIRVTNKDTLRELYDGWAMTWEGLCESDFELARETCGKTPDVDLYVISGKYMNEAYELKGLNRYPEDLHIVAILDYKGLAMQYGARWFTDIVDNNARKNKLA